MLSDLYNEHINTERLTTVLDESGIGTNQKEFIANLADVDCHIQTLDENATKDITNGFGKDLRMFCDVVDITEGDRVIRDPLGEVVEYRVVGVKKFNNYGGNSHLEVRIRAFRS